MSVSARDKKKLIPNSGDFNDSRSKKVFTENGDLFIYDMKSKERREFLTFLFYTGSSVFNGQTREYHLFRLKNAFIYDLENGSIKQLTHFKRVLKNRRIKRKTSQIKMKWLEKENLEFLEVVNQRKEDEESSEKLSENL